MARLNYRGLDLGEILQQDPNLGTQYRNDQGQERWFNDPYTTQTEPGSFVDNPGSAEQRMANFNANGPVGGVSEQQLQNIAQGIPTSLPPNALHGRDRPPSTEAAPVVPHEWREIPGSNNPIASFGPNPDGLQTQGPGSLGQRAYAMGGQRQAPPQYAGPAYYGPPMQDNARAYGGYGGGYQMQPFQMMQPQFPQWNPGYGGYQSQFQFSNPYLGSVGSGMGYGGGGGGSAGMTGTLNPDGSLNNNSTGAYTGGGGQQAAPIYSPPMMPNGINPNLVGTPGYNQYTGYGQQQMQQPYRPPAQYGMGGGYPMPSAVMGSYPQRTPTQSRPYTGPPLAFGGVPAYQGTSGGGYGANLYGGMASNQNMYGARNTGGPGPGPSSGGVYNPQLMYPQSPFQPYSQSSAYRPQANPSVGHGTIGPAAPPPTGSTGYTGSAGGLYGGMAGTGY